MDCNGLYTLLDNIRVQIYDKHDKIYELQALSVNCISVNVQIKQLQGELYELHVMYNYYTDQLTTCMNNTDCSTCCNGYCSRCNL